MPSTILILDNNDPLFVIGEIEVTNAKIYERINDKYTFEFTCYEQENSNLIAQQTLIFVDDDYFRIATVKETPIDKKYEVYCEHISYELNVVSPHAIDDVWEYNGWIGDVINEMLLGTRFSFVPSDDLPNVKDFVTDTKPIRSRILELCAFCGFEVNWNRFDVAIQARRGADNGLTIELGKNLKDLTINKTFEFDGSITTNYDIDFVDLNKILDTDGNPLEIFEFHMGDTVNLKLNPTRIVKQRGVAVGYDPFSRALPTIELQNVVNNIVEDIANGVVSESKLETMNDTFVNGMVFKFTKPYAKVVSVSLSASGGGNLTYTLNKNIDDLYVSVTVNGTASGKVNLQAVCK